MTDLTRCGSAPDLHRARLLDGVLALGRMCGYCRVVDEFVSAFSSVCDRLVKSDMAGEVDAG